MKTDYIEIQLPEGTNLTKVPMTNLERRRLLCADLEYLITEDKAIREELIDEYVYLLSDKRLEEMEEYVKKELEADY